MRKPSAVNLTAENSSGGVELHCFLVVTQGAAVVDCYVGSFPKRICQDVCCVGVVLIYFYV